MNRRIFALVPIKDLTLAKSRLAPMLDAGQRRSLMQAMARDVVSILQATPTVERVVLVSDTPDLPSHLEVLSVSCFAPGGGNLNADLAEAASWAESQGASHALIVHADLPCLTEAALETFLEQAEPSIGLRIAACRSGTGTNLLYAPLPLPIPLLFGRDSLSRFRGAADAAGIDLAVCSEPHLGADIDEFNDILALQSLDPNLPRPNIATSHWLATMLTNTGDIREPD